MDNTSQHLITVFSGERQSPPIGILNVLREHRLAWVDFKGKVESTLVGKIWNCTRVLIPGKVTTRGSLSGAEFLLNPIGERKNGPLPSQGSFSCWRIPSKVSFTSRMKSISFCAGRTK